MENSSSFRGKVVLVTGSSRGIGAEVAMAFARTGARVVLHGRDRNSLFKVKEAIISAGGEAILVQAELTDFHEIERMRLEIEEAYSPPDIVVANAGGSIAPPGPIEQISIEDWQKTLDANLTTTFLTLKSFLPGMKKRGSGIIITISSSAGRVPHPFAPVPYGAAKAAIIMLTQNVASQVGPNGIRVNCIAPETILTERNLQRIPVDRQKAMIGAHPLRRLGTPEDVARAILFLASDDASWITGSVLDIHGGASLV